VGIFLKTEILPGCQLGVWEITEDYDTLFSMVRLATTEKVKLEDFKSENRKLEWLSVRALVKQMTGKDMRIVYTADNKPYLRGRTYHISISHSHQLTAILLSHRKRVGIDLEYMSGKIDDISDKFINDQEVITSDPGMVRFHLYIHWCAKEALYKICDKKDVNFRNSLIIKPFEPKEHGFFTGCIINKRGREEYEMEYLLHDNYALVWCCKE